MMELHEKGWVAQLRPTLFRCSSSARTVQEASDSEADWEQSTACWEVEVSSARTASETSLKGESEVMRSRVIDVIR